MSTLMEFAMFPTDKGESVSGYVSRIIQMIDKSGINYSLTPMGTIIETKTLKEALIILEKAYAKLETDCNRIYTTIKKDIRKGKENRMEEKIHSIEKKIGSLKKGTDQST
jgi:uncharacterized protein (TIGR00106 family)